MQPWTRPVMKILMLRLSIGNLGSEMLVLCKMGSELSQAAPAEAIWLGVMLALFYYTTIYMYHPCLFEYIGWGTHCTSCNELAWYWGTYYTSYTGHMCHVGSANPLSHGFYSLSQISLTILENDIKFSTLKGVHSHLFWEHKPNFRVGQPFILQKNENMFSECFKQ